jgi:hypothetical protein
MTDFDVNPYLENLGLELPVLDTEGRRIIGVLFNSEGVFYEVDEKTCGVWGETSSYIHVDEPAAQPR